MRVTRLITDPIKAIRTLMHLWRHMGVGPHHAIADFLRFRKLIDAHHNDFFFGRLWDRGLSVPERLRFLSHNDRVRLQPLIGTKADQVAVRDKALAAETLRRAGVPGPEVLAAVSTRSPADGEGRVVRSLDALRGFLGEPHEEGLVFKPASGTQGHDIHIFRHTGPDRLTNMTGESWSVERLWAILSRPPTIASFIKVSNDWLIERRTPPHADLARIHGDTLGCVRVVTMLFDDGSVGLLEPSWKIPVGTSGIDNLKYGSLFAPVDLETGAVGTVIYEPTMLPVDRHPDTDVPLSGITLPDWEDAKEVCRRAQAAFPAIRSLGFDVGLTMTGPRIVECNAGWGIWVMQAPQRRGIIHGEFLRFLEELGAEGVIRRDARRL